MATDLTVANEILRQLGGGRFRMMIGARDRNDVVGSEDSLTVKLKRGSTKNKAVFFIVTLNGNDLYDVEFVKFKRDHTKVVISRHEDIYNDMLVSLFETETGLYTKL